MRKLQLVRGGAAVPEYFRETTEAKRAGTHELRLSVFAADNDMRSGLSAVAKIRLQIAIN